MEITTPLYVAVGLFLLIFGPIVISAARPSQPPEGTNVGWQLTAVIITLVAAVAAAVASGWVYLLQNESQFLLQTGVALFIAFGSSVAIIGYRRRDKTAVQYAVDTLNNRLLLLSGLTMTLCGLFMVISLPFISDPSDEIEQARNILLGVGVAGGFSTVGFLLIGLFFAAPTD